MTSRLFFLSFLLLLPLWVFHRTAHAAEPNPVCGDGYLLEKEGCDDGNKENELCPYGMAECDVCNDKCKIASGETWFCGDGVVNEEFENCDHNNVLELDCDYGENTCEVCLPHCQLGLGRPSTCGDGKIDRVNGEYCDPSHPNYLTCPYGEDLCQQCSNNCEFVQTVGIFCGDSTIQEDYEQCDDGNTDKERCPANNPSCQICNGQCQWEEGDGSFCGDGQVDEMWGEVCDDGVFGPSFCPYGETCEYCNDDCLFETIQGFLCGDESVQTQSGEGCDYGELNGEPCPYGNTSCNQICNDECTLVWAQPIFCGDGQVQAEHGEICDTGSHVGTGCTYGETQCVTCDEDCSWVLAQGSFCGDGVFDSENGESCDDGNNITELCPYGEECTICDASCQTQNQSASYCGDSIVDVAHGETCDDGNQEAEECPYNFLSCQVCDSQCHWVSGAIRYCGDGVEDEIEGEFGQTIVNELCDDGTQEITQCDYGVKSCVKCTNTCGWDIRYGPYCGDGLIQTEYGETCDLGVAVSNTCAYGAAACEVCTLDCHIQPGETQFCGDGILQDTYEACDSEPRTAADCDYADPSCKFCNHLCQWGYADSPNCGDGIIDSEHGEACDDGNTFTESCLYGQISCSVCDENCQWATGETEYCGDGQITQNETCEDGNNYTEACSDYDVTCTTDCNSQCQTGEGLKRFCGDGIIDEPQEVCDFGAENGGTVCAYGEAQCDICTGECQPDTASGPYCGDGLLHDQESCDDAIEEDLPQATCVQCLLQCTQDNDWRFYMDQNGNGQDGCEDAVWGKTIDVLGEDLITDLRLNHGLPWIIEEQVVDNVRIHQIRKLNSFGDQEASWGFQSVGASQNFDTQLTTIVPHPSQAPWLIGHACIASTQEEVGLPCTLEVSPGDAFTLDLQTHLLGTPFMVQVNTTTITSLATFTPTDANAELHWGHINPHVGEFQNLLPVQCSGIFQINDEENLDCDAQTVTFLSFNNSVQIYSSNISPSSNTTSPFFRSGDTGQTYHQALEGGGRAVWRHFELQTDPTQLVFQHSYKFDGEGLELTFFSASASNKQEEWFAYGIENISDQTSTLSLSKCSDTEGENGCEILPYNCLAENLLAGQTYVLISNISTLDDCQQQFLFSEDFVPNAKGVRLFAGTNEHPIGGLWLQKDESDHFFTTLQFPLGSSSESSTTLLGINGLQEIDKSVLITEYLLMVSGKLSPLYGPMALDAQNEGAVYTPSECNSCASQTVILKTRIP